MLNRHAPLERTFRRRDEWLSVWHQRGVDAERGEPGTTGYVACTDLEEPSHVMIWERYTEPAALEAHTSRKAHAQLMDDMGSRNMTKRIVFGGLNFTDVPGVGYWGRDERVLTEKQQQRGTVRALSALCLRRSAFAALPPVHSQTTLARPSPGRMLAAAAAAFTPGQQR